MVEGIFGERFQDIIKQLRDDLGFVCESTALECVEVGRAYVCAVVFESPTVIKIYGAHSGNYEPDSVLIIDINTKRFKVEKLKPR